jgi:predicted RND superfamily exporter protein
MPSYNGVAPLKEAVPPTRAPRRPVHIRDPEPGTSDPPSLRPTWTQEWLRAKLLGSRPNMRRKISFLFEQWGRWVAARPYRVLLAIAATVTALGVQIPRIDLDTTTEGFLRKDDPILAVYDDFRARFGRDDAIVLGVEADDVFAPVTLTKLRAMHAALAAEVPLVDEITSLLNARWTRGEGDELIVEDLIAEWPTTPEDFAALRARAFSNPLYRNVWLNDDATITTVQIDLDTYVQDGTDESGAPVLRYLNGEEIGSVVATIAAVASRFDENGFRVHAAGTPWLTEKMAYHTRTDFRRLTLLSIAVMMAVLFVVFRTLQGVVLPMLVVIATVVCTLGLLVLLGIPYQQPTQIVPVSLLAIGLGDSVHVLSLYRQRRNVGMSRIDAIAQALGHTGVAVVMTSVTTAAAMMSFLSAELAPIANIGILVPAGVMIALVLTLTLLPAAIVVFPEPRSVARRPALGRSNRAIAVAGTWAARHPWPVVIVSAALIVASLAGASRIRFSHNPLSWFPPHDSMRVATETLNAKLGGVMNVEVLFDTKREGGVQEPEFLSALDDLARIDPHATPVPSDAPETTAVLRVAKSISIADLLKEINKALNENREDRYELPDTRELVAQELLLFEMSGNNDLEELTDYRYQTARMMIRVPWADATLYGGFLDSLVAAYRERMGESVEIVSTGMLPLLFRTLTAAIHSMGRSYVLAFLAVTPLMVLLLGSVRLGLLAMIPNLLPIVAVLGLMGAVGLPLDLFSLLTGSIVLGLAVDDTIHFTNGFGRELAEHGDAVAAVRNTLETTGQAMFFTTVILCTGFGVFCFAYMRNGVVFGSVTAVALGIALLADVLLAPALFVLVSRGDRARVTERRAVAHP